MMTDAQCYRRGAIATPHYQATLAGAAVLADGGNAVDAILAANLALGVVAPYYCGYGGDLLALVWDGNALQAFRSTGRSPAAATAERVRELCGSDEMPVVGPHTVTVPGAIAGWFGLVERFGTRSFGALAARARVLAEDGFVLTRAGAFRLANSAAIPGALGVDDAALRATYANVRPGDVVVQPALARTIAALADQGPDVYYRGPIGEAIAATLAAHGGVMTAADVAAHVAEYVEPMHAPFMGVDVYEMPPPTQGVTALEMLRMAEQLGVGDDGVDRVHMQIEISKLALADRDTYVTDPDYMTIDPAAVFGDELVSSRAALVDRGRARPVEPRSMADGGTAYLCCADGDGMCVSLIQSNFTAIGSGVHVGEWGINLHNRGASFSLDPSHCNVIAPSKLPMHTLIPAMVLRDGRPEYVFGTMGGHVQAQIHLQVLTRLLHDGDDPLRAVSAPRFAVDPASGGVGLEARFDANWVDELERRGHRVRAMRAYDDGAGHAHAIQRLSPGWAIGSDPRAESATAGI
ncbi:MAG TPA: gamma-glutamyltransferase family protein [Acidimicrobiia bacterium]|jgi:gamma-glutamyltranspeptidase/glutathione hydrolase